jgi:hypothetical protein
LVLGDGTLEGAMNLAETVPQDIGEAEQNGGAQPAQLEAVDQSTPRAGSLLGWTVRCPASLIEK